MPAVVLDFVPPEEPGWVELEIYESATKEGAPGVLIETVTDIGDHPDYITRYSTDQATSGVAWFSIRWKDDKGAVTPLSDPVQGGTFSLVWKVASRVMMRDSTLDEGVVTQDAEAVIAKYLNVEDPYAVDASTVSLNTLSGLVYLTLARAYISELVSGSESDSYTAGLVSQKSSTTDAKQRAALIAQLIAFANDLLGLNVTVVMLLKDIDPTGIGSMSSVSYDHSRLLLEIE